MPQVVSQTRGQLVMWHRLALLLCALTLWVPRPAHAERVQSLIPGGKSVEVPKELLPWVPWVTQSVTEGLCPKLGEQELCQWPAVLSLDVGSEGADFSFEIYLETEGAVVLPGSRAHWPESVEVDGKTAIVLSRDSNPVTSLQKGPHRLTGRFLWKQAPETLELPAQVGLVALRVNGRAVEFPRREASGAVWLQVGGKDSEQASERVEVQVFRRLDDDVPLRVTTLLVLSVAGRTREVRLQGATLPNSRWLSVESPIPARYEPNGDLLLQAHAGEHRLTLKSHFPTPPERIELSQWTAPWPDHETWVFVPNSAMRQVEIVGAPGVDPAQTNLPEDWRSHQAWLVSKENALSFQTKRRGEPEPAPNQLSLVRDWWLDFDGQGYTASDQLTGTLSDKFRLDLASATLGHAASDGKDLLITRSPEGKTGVELRQPKLALKAEWRLEQATSVLPAVGWQADVNELRSTLHLPPGWELLHATGVDHLSDTWWSSWSLWGFFYVLLVAIAVARLLSPGFGALAFLTLVITYARADAPMGFWAVLLVLLALLRLVPPGRFRRGLRLVWLGAVLAFAVVAVEFSVGEIRGAFFPTTRDAAETSLAPQRAVEAVAPMAVEQRDEASVAEQAVVAKMALSSVSGQMKGYGGRLGGGAPKAYESAVIDPEAIVQTGPGLPNWQWKSVRLTWSGPVRQDQRVQLYLLGPASNRVLGVLRVLAVALLGLLLVRKTPFGDDPPTLPRLLTRRWGFAVPVSLLFLLGSPEHASAEPRVDTLETLKTRLVAVPDCAGCLEVESLELEMKGRMLATVAFVHAGKVMDYRVPGPVQSWVPARVLVDGKPADAMVLGSDGFLHVRVETGTHRVRTEGPVAGNELVISPGSVPHRVSVTANGWAVDGLRDGRVENGLHFTAEQRATAPTGDVDPGAGKGNRLPPWLEITRHFELDVTWKVTTEVVRKSPVGEPVSLRYALLPGEEVTTAAAIVEQGQLIVTLGRDDGNVSYTSVLGRAPVLKLVAQSERPFSEEWRVRCGALLHCEFAGVAPYARADERGYAPRFRPWPKEQLAVQIQKPVVAPGDSHTIERIDARVTPGQRLLTGTLELTVKVSKSYTQTIRLESGALVQKLTINGREEPIRMNGSRLELLLQPGRQQIVVGWREPRPQSVFFRTPRLELENKAVNVKVALELPSERWLWFTWGPSWGPKVLLWSYLLMLIGAAFILVRIPRNPLKLWQWILLGVGLTQIPVAVTLGIAAWFFLMALRGGLSVERAWVKKLIQIALALCTLAFLGCLGAAVYDGLVSNPDMLVAGNGSNSLLLTWYVDRITGSLPTALVVSVPVVVFRLLNLLWALWLASSLLGWLRWGWSQYAAGGLWAEPTPKE